MKTTTLNTLKIKIGIISFVLSCGALFLFSSCQKEQLATINSGVNQSAAERNKAKNTTYTMFVFDYPAARTNLPDYIIEINTDGTVVFLGRRNTAFIGTKILHVSQETIGFLKEPFAEKSSMKFKTKRNMEYEPVMIHQAHD